MAASVTCSCAASVFVPYPFVNAALILQYLKISHRFLKLYHFLKNVSHIVLQKQMYAGI